MPHGDRAMIRESRPAAGIRSGRPAGRGMHKRFGAIRGTGDSGQGRFGSGAETGAVTPARRIPAGTAERRRSPGVRNRVSIRQRLCGKVTFGERGRSQLDGCCPP